MMRILELIYLSNKVQQIYKSSQCWAFILVLLTGNSAAKLYRKYLFYIITKVAVFTVFINNNYYIKTIFNSNLKPNQSPVK